MAAAAQGPSLFARLRTWVAIYDDVLFQRSHVRHWRGLRPDDLCEEVAGRTFIVTGPTRCVYELAKPPAPEHRNSGIGKEVAAALARRGATGAGSPYCIMLRPLTRSLSCARLPQQASWGGVGGGTAGCCCRCGPASAAAGGCGA